MKKGINIGKTIKVHYIGMYEDGTQFESTYERGEPLEFLCGYGYMLNGFDHACEDLESGDITEITLSPKEAYGMPDPKAIVTVDLKDLDGETHLKVGDVVTLTNSLGQPTPAVVTAKDTKTITFDTNHKMAGKTLKFRIEMI